MDFRTRAQWGAQFDVTTRAKMALPVNQVYVHHNVMEPTGDPNADMRATEAVDIARFGCPSYKYAIHPSGVVLEGMSDHGSPDTLNHNSDSISIMFMGNFENDQPTAAAMFAGRQLVDLLKAYGFVTKDYRLMGHRDVYATACPGAHLYPRIQELTVAPPAEKPKDNPVSLPVVRKDNNMVIQDPTTGGYWVAYDDGAIQNFDGAPFLGGANNDKMNAIKFPCVGIAPYKDTKGDGYCLILDFGPPPRNTGDRFRRYRFPRDGSAKV